MDLSTDSPPPEPPSESETDLLVQTDSEHDLESEYLESESASETEVEVDTVSPSPLSSWQSMQQKNRKAAATLLPAIRKTMLRVQEGSTRDMQCCSCEHLALLRCLDCSATMRFCSPCWRAQHSRMRISHIPEVYTTHWERVHSFVQRAIVAGGVESSTIHPVCASTPREESQGTAVR